MKCIKCWGDTKVLETRDKIDRRRECLVCGERFNTQETATDPLEPFRQWVRERIRKDPENAYPFTP